MKKAIPLFIFLFVSFSICLTSCSTQESAETDRGSPPEIGESETRVVTPESKDTAPVDVDDTGSSDELDRDQVVGLISDGKGGSNVVVYDCATWEYQIMMELPEVTPDNYAALSSDDKKLAYTTWSKDHTIRYLTVVDVETGSEDLYFEDMPPFNEIIKISWMPDNVSLLYIRNDANMSMPLQSIEYVNVVTGAITLVDQGEVWKIRQVDAFDSIPEPFVLPGSKEELSVKYSEPTNTDDERWYYYLDENDLRAIYEKYGGVRDFDLSTIINYMSVKFSAPRCSADGNTIIYSAILDRNSALGSQTPLWIAGAIWAYDVISGETKIVYKQEDEAAIGRVDWIGENEICFVTYYDHQGSRDNINHLDLETMEADILFHYSDEHYNNVTLLPIGSRKISFTSSKKDSLYSSSQTYGLDVDTKEFEMLNILYHGESVILENFIYQ